MGVKKGFVDRIRIVGAIIDLEHLDFAYGDQLVLKQITLPIEEGSTLGVIGPNGGGKSTLLKLLLNQHRPTRGTIRIAGFSPRDAVARGDVLGYLPQNHPINESFPISVRQVARLGLAGKTGMLRPYGKDVLKIVVLVVERVGGAGLAGRAVWTHSGRQRERALIG